LLRIVLPLPGPARAVRQSREACPTPPDDRLMSGSPKKVIVRTTDHAVLAGYLPISGVVNHATGFVELLDTAGRLLPVDLKAVRYIAYVRDFNLNDTINPERLLRKTFLARPRTEGLWVRIHFADGDVLEGLASLDLGLLDDAMDDEGIFLIPPDVRSNTQRLYVPRSSMATLQLVAVITTPSRTAPPAKPERDETRLPFPEVAS
jgi:hypothetical protein